MHFFPDLLCHTDDRFDLIRPKCPGHPPSALSDQHIWTCLLFHHFLNLLILIVHYLVHLHIVLIMMDHPVYIEFRIIMVKHLQHIKVLSVSIFILLRCQSLQLFLIEISHFIHPLNIIVLSVFISINRLKTLIHLVSRLPKNMYFLLQTVFWKILLLVLIIINFVDILSEILTKYFIPVVLTSSFHIFLAHWIFTIIWHYHFFILKLILN